MRFIRPNPARAFTLIELLVVMSILVILLVIALPVFNYITAARSTESGVNMVSAMLSRARTLSLNTSADTYVGVLFYPLKDDDRDAMQLVELTTLVPPDRYAHWQIGGSYYIKPTAPADPPGPDRYFSQLPDPNLPAPFTNRPVVKMFEAVQASTGATGNKPGAPPLTKAPFDNAFWVAKREGNVTPVLLDSEAQMLPRGVRVAVIKQVGTTYDRPGIVVFDKQGRLSVIQWGIVNDSDPAKDGGEKLLEALGQPYNATTGQYDELPIGGDRVTAMGVAAYNDADVTVDRNDITALRGWIENNATQLTVGTQSGELVQAQ
ncbi:MAG TPA: prepilin-type N-terminal cleavage/methylation domain-containing protein [Tepidisphaeraceae bacterium]|jgi:prepilin-type N-terminal cleavage/methylation domain-containing protein